ncbi:MAG TPA: NHL repeat-containing protein [Sedimentisphaerales bacterium]|nr:NHL repeat-containing protein [Sedimentisphaerales bacterium]HRS11554.1 NHL repeat-containing protein [Sedimentisphaerales bacterium]HRV48194.1 NHL repeat-containing protein [Sedimentisphaerales bacterium]
MNQPQGKTDSGVIIGVLIGTAVLVAIVAVLRVDTTGQSGSGLSDAYELDAVMMARFDPNLIAYREVEPAIATGFARSRALTLDGEGQLYIAGDKAVRVLSNKGTLEHVIAVSGEPRCVAVSSEGRVYVGLRNHVEVFDATGERLAAWEPLGDRSFLSSILVAGDSVFVADAGNAVVLRYDKTGKSINRIGEKDPSRDIPGFVVPSPYFDLALAPDGLLRVVSPGRTRVEAYTFDGDLEFSWGENSIRIHGFCGCCNPVNIAMLPDGRYVTAEKGLIRVKIYDAKGTFQSVVAGPEQLVKGGAARVFENAEDAEASGFDVAVDAAGRIYVLDTIENKVRIFVENQKGRSE